MNKIINILIFSVVTATLSYCAPLELMQDETLEIITSDSRPTTISTNFEISDVKLIAAGDVASVEILKKGFVIVPKIKKYQATIVLSARNGTVYSLSVTGTGKKSIYRIEDPLQNYVADDKFEFESGKMDQDARNIIKSILINKKMSGFKKSNAYHKINTTQYLFERLERYSGSKYVIDKWTITNTSKDSLYFNEEDFYTKGVLAVAIEKNRVLAGEKIFLITILNKNQLYINSGKR